MNNIVANDLTPAEVFPISELIKDEMEAQNLDKMQLAQLADLELNTVDKLLANKISLNPDIAIALEKALGINADFWLRYQIKYEIDLIKIKYRELIQKSNLSPIVKKSLENV
jgi:HTH-type transcriptional regulator / antitoxin HigA